MRYRSKGGLTQFATRLGAVVLALLVLAAIALALIAFLPLLLDGIAAVPLVGMLALMVILLTLVAHRELPGKFPGALAAVLSDSQAGPSPLPAARIMRRSGPVTLFCDAEAASGIVGDGAP